MHSPVPHHHLVLALAGRIGTLLAGFVYLSQTVSVAELEVSLHGPACCSMCFACSPVQKACSTAQTVMSVFMVCVQARVMMHDLTVSYQPAENAIAFCKGLFTT